jgi:2-octaprenyl-6-methoxyphenol hydroxylase
VPDRPMSDNQPSITNVDVAIICGGMVGASLAVALAGTGVVTMLVEGTEPGAQSQPSFDDRTTALGNASRRIFQSLGVWERMAGEAAAIRSIHVSDAGRFGFARLNAADQGIDAFGYVVPNRSIGAALWEKLRAAQGVLLRVPAKPDQVDIGTDGVTFTLTAGPRSSPECVLARLVVAADGAHSVVRGAAGIEAEVEDYGQVAVVANVAADRPHDGTAFERFTESGPLAVLPLHDGSYGVIWACTPARAAEVLAFPDEIYLRELQLRFGWRVGRFMRAGVRGSYPLKLTRAKTTVATRTVLIGNAAQALHPVAGQGFNLGLRDAAMLAEVVASTLSPSSEKHEPNDAGSAELLRKFAEWRAGDRAGVVRFTDSLVKLFGDARLGMGVLRNLGLLLFDLAPPAKSALARVSAGFSGPTPRLARGLGVRP